VTSMNAAVCQAVTARPTREKCQQEYRLAIKLTEER
jgi:hypothetical protein